MNLLEKIEGGIIGVAVGDALGVPVEFKSRAYLKEKPIIDLIGNQIQKAENQDLNIIDLGRLNLELMFPNLGLSGEAHLYYNRKTNQFLRK